MDIPIDSGMSASDSEDEDFEDEFNLNEEDVAASVDSKNVRRAVEVRCQPILYAKDVSSSPFGPPAGVVSSLR